jgi:hypothetical protein
MANLARSAAASQSAAAEPQAGHVSAGSRGSPSRGLSPSANLPCACRVCVAKSLQRALAQMARGRHEIAAHIVFFSLLDLVRDANFVTDVSSQTQLLCEGIDP